MPESLPNEPVKDSSPFSTQQLAVMALDALGYSRFTPQSNSPNRPSNPYLGTDNLLGSMASAMIRLPDFEEARKLLTAAWLDRKSGLDFKIAEVKTKIQRSRSADPRNNTPIRISYGSNTQGTELLVRRLIRAWSFVDENHNLDPDMRKLRQTNRLELGKNDLRLIVTRPEKIGPEVNHPIQAAYRVQLQIGQ